MFLLHFLPKIFLPLSLAYTSEFIHTSQATGMSSLRLPGVVSCSFFCAFFSPQILIMYLPLSCDLQVNKTESYVSYQFMVGPRPCRAN